METVGAHFLIILKFEMMKAIYTLSFILIFNCTMFAQFQYINVHLDLNDIQYNPITNRIVGSSPGTSPLGNAILIINPDNLKIEDTICVKSDPKEIVFNKTFTKLYISYSTFNGLDYYDFETKTLHNIEIFDSKQCDHINILDNGNKEIICGIIASYGGQQGGVFYYKDNEIKYGSGSAGSTSVVMKNNKLVVFNYDKIDEYSYINDSLTITNNWQFFSGGSAITSITVMGDTLFLKSPIAIEIKDGNLKVLNEPFVSSEVTGYDEKYIYRRDYKWDINTYDRSSFALIDSEPTWMGEIEKWINLGETGKMAMFTKNSIDQSVLSSPLKNPGGQLYVRKKCNNTPLTNLKINASSSKYCYNEPVRLNIINPIDNNKYMWSNGLEGDSIVFDNNLSVIKIFAVSVDSNGCITNRSDSLKISFFDFPEDFNQFDVDSGQCPDEEWVITTSAINAQNYLWSNGMIGKQIKVIEPGYYTVTASYGKSCVKTLEKTIFLKHYLDSVPKAMIKPVGLISLCAGEELTVHALDFYDEYNWKGTYQQIKKEKAIINNAGTYSLRYVKSGCIGPESDKLIVSINPKPAKPTVSLQNGLIKVNSTTDSVLWYVNGVFDENLQGKNIAAAEDVLYSAQVVSSKGCKSDVVSIYYSVKENYPLNCQVFVDQNLNNVYDSGDYFGEDIPITIGQVNTIYSGKDGRASVYVPEGIYTLEPYIDNAIWELKSPLIPHVAMIDLNSDTVFQYAIYPKFLIEKVYVHGHSGFARCNQHASMMINLRNTGTITTNGQACLTFDNRLSTIIVNSTVINLVDNQHCFDIFNLHPYSDTTIFFQYLIPDPTFGDSIYVDVKYLNSKDEFISEFHLKELIRCSYDPNDKLVSPSRGENGNYALFSDILTYTIRFQNTGNDTAFYVRLEDQLSNLLDWNTFEPVYASHPNEANLDQRTGLLKVIFNPIRLLDSTTNVIESQGFFTFKIKPRLPITENTILENFALIYFDYNKPIVTNTTKSVFVSTLVSIVQEEEFKCNFHPNPTNGLTFFTSTIDKPFKFFLYNNLGEEILYKDIQSSNFELDLSNYANGVYSFMIKLNNGFTSGKIVKL